MTTVENTALLPFLSWDTDKILEAHANFLVENGEAIDDQTAFKLACGDCDLLTIEWEYVVESVTDIITTLNPNGVWCAEVTNFGWRKRHGFKTFTAHDGQRFLAAILPDTECSFNLYLSEGCIRIQNFHHDAPTGAEWYTLTPAIEAGEGV